MSAPADAKVSFSVGLGAPFFPFFGSNFYGPRYYAPTYGYYAYSPAPYVVAPTVRTYASAHVAWCQAHYRSYNLATDLFLGYDGQYHYCNSPY